MFCARHDTYSILILDCVKLTGKCELRHTPVFYNNNIIIITSLFKEDDTLSNTNYLSMISMIINDFHLSLTREWPSIVARERIIPLKFEQYSGLTQ